MDLILFYIVDELNESNLKQYVTDMDIVLLYEVFYSKLSNSDYLKLS